MLNQIFANKEWVFSGIGVLVITGVISFIFKKNKPDITQKIKSGKNSKNIQSTGNVTISMGDDKNKKSR